MHRALSNQYQYEIREQSCATVSSVAVARQGAQCGARLLRWIKVRSAGHDIPRSTDRWRPERDNHRLRNQTKETCWLCARVPPRIDVSIFAIAFTGYLIRILNIFRRIFTRSIDRLFARIDTKPSCKCRKKCRSNTSVYLLLPELIERNVLIELLPSKKLILNRRIFSFYCFNWHIIYSLSTIIFEEIDFEP